MIASLFKYAPVQVFSALSLFVLISIHSRFLVPEEYGLLAILLVFSEGARSVLIQWINSCLFRFYSVMDIDNKAALISQSTRWLIFFLVLSSFVIAALMLAFSLFSFVNFIAVYILLISKSVYLYLIECTRIKEKSSIYRRVVLTQSILVMCVTFIALNWHANIVVAILSLASSYFISILIVGFKMDLSVRLSVDQHKEVISYGMPFMLSGLIGILATRSDRLLIASITNLEQAGIYSAVNNLLMGVMSIVFMIVALPLYPELTKIVEDRQSLYRRHKTYSGILLALTLPALVGVCLIAPIFIDVFLGESYHEIDLRIWYLISFSAWLINIKGHYFDHGFQFIFKTKWMPAITSFILLVQVTLSIIFIPKYGALGAAGCLAVAFTIGALCSLFIGIQLGYKYPFPQELHKTLISTMVMSATIYYFLDKLGGFIAISKLLILVSIGLLSYLSMHIILNSFLIRSQFKVWRR